MDEDDNGLPEVKTEIIPNIRDLVDYSHSPGLKLGLYILPNAFSTDFEPYVKGTTNFRIGELPYDC